jgi:hypothetical protein
MNNVKKIATLITGLVVVGLIIAFILVYLIIYTLTAGSKLAPFKEFRSNEGRFTVLLPGEPKREDQSADTPVGKVEMFMFTAGTSKIGCAISYTDYPEQMVNSTDPQKVLDGARNGAVSNVQGQLVSESKVNFYGLPARDVVIEIPNKAFITTRLILASPRFYQLMFIAPTDKGHEQDISKFFDSFEIDGVK